MVRGWVAREDFLVNVFRYMFRLGLGGLMSLAYVSKMLP